MKKLTIYLLSLIALAVTPIFGQSRQWVLPTSQTHKSTHANAEKKQSVFASKEECGAAYKSRNFSYYVPTHLGMTEKKPVDGITTKAYALERDTFADMLVFGNRFAWVILEEGTVCRYNLLPDGSPFPEPYAHHACGNPIKSIGYPTASTPKKVAEPTVVPSPQVSVSAPEPIVVHAPAPQVFVQVPAPQVTVVPAPPVYVQAPAPVYQHPIVLPPLVSMNYGSKPMFDEAPRPEVPKVKGIGWGWKLAAAIVGGFIVYKALDNHKKPADPQRAVVTDPPTAGRMMPPAAYAPMGGGGIGFRF